MWRRRLALQIASQLPDDPDDAFAVLAAAQECVHFASGGPRCAKVVRLGLAPPAVQKKPWRARLAGWMANIPARMPPAATLAAVFTIGWFAPSPEIFSPAGADALIQFQGAKLRSNVVRVGEPLILIFRLTQHANCDGNVIRTYLGEPGHERVAVEQYTFRNVPLAQHGVDNVVQVNLPPEIGPGHYALQTSADLRCGERAIIHNLIVGLMPFTVVE